MVHSTLPTRAPDHISPTIFLPRMRGTKYQTPSSPLPPFAAHKACGLDVISRTVSHAPKLDHFVAQKAEPYDVSNQDGPRRAAESHSNMWQRLFRRIVMNVTENNI